MVPGRLPGDGAGPPHGGAPPGAAGRPRDGAVRQWDGQPTLPRGEGPLQGGGEGES